MNDVIHKNKISLMMSQLFRTNSSNYVFAYNCSSM